RAQRAFPLVQGVIELLLQRRLDFGSQRTCERDLLPAGRTGDRLVSHGASFAERVSCAVLRQLYSERVTGLVIRLFFVGEPAPVANPRIVRRRAVRPRSLVPGRRTQGQAS